MASASRIRRSDRPLTTTAIAIARASIADIRDVLRYESDQMTRVYAGKARKFAAASLMTKYSLAG